MIWKEHYHDILERACMTYGGDPCLFGKVTLTCDHHGEKGKIAVENVNVILYALQIQVDP